MKRFISLAMMLLLIISSVPIVSFTSYASAPVDTSPFFVDDMSVTEASNVNGVLISRDSAVIMTEDSTNKVMQIGPGLTGWQTYWKPSPHVSDTFKMSMKLKIPSIDTTGLVGNSSNVFWKLVFYNSNNTEFQTLQIKLVLNSEKNFYAHSLRVDKYDNSKSNEARIPNELFNDDGTTKDWILIDIVFDFDARTMHVFANGNLIVVNSVKSDVPLSLREAALANRSSVGVTSYFDDVTLSYVEKFDATVKGADDGSFDKFVLDFNSELDSDGLQASDITISDENGAPVTINSSTVVPTAVSTCGTSGKSYEVTLNERLEPSTRYKITLNGISETKYGLTLNGKEIEYITREKRCKVLPVKYYTTYVAPEDVSNVEVSTLTNGTITAEITTENERTEMYKADLLVVHKRDNKILDASIVSADTAAEAFKTSYASVTVSDVTTNDKVEVYLWDMWGENSALNSLNALKPAEWITTIGKNIESGYSQSTATDMTGNMSINFTKNVATLAGALTQGDISEVCALVFNNGYSHETLTRSNFKAAVMCIGQNPSNAEGAYSIELPLNNPIDGNIYSSVMGTSTKLITDSKQYFSTNTVNAAISAVNGSDAETLRKYLAKEIELVTNVYLNDVLQLDLSVYNTLQYRIFVCEQMINKNFVDIPSIRTRFASEVANRKAKEDRIDALLLSVTDALWNDIEQILLADKNSNNDLELTWTNYDTYIKNNNELKIIFYKKLASDYTFSQLKTLQDTFSNLAYAVYEDSLASGGSGSKGSGSGSGGSGGGMVSFVGGKTQIPTPIVPEKAGTSSSTPNFKDISSVPWAEEAIKSLASAGVINGISSDEFAPNDIVTREQFVKMIVLAFGLYDESAQSNDFIDVNKNHWSSQYIASAIAKNLINGIDSQHFGIGQELTRAEMATILNRIITALGMDLPQNNGEIIYTDGSDIPDYAKDGVSVMSKAGIINGIGNGAFAPREKTTRAMAAKVIHLLRGMCR